MAIQAVPQCIFDAMGIRSLIDDLSSNDLENPQQFYHAEHNLTLPSPLHLCRYPIARDEANKHGTLIHMVISGQIQKNIDQIQQLSDAEQETYEEEIQQFQCSIAFLKTILVYHLATSSNLTQKRLNYSPQFGAIQVLDSMIGTESIASCACCDNLDVTHRLNFTKEIIKNIFFEMFADEDCLNVSSIGSGLCYYELMFHAVILTQKPYQVNWRLIDPKFADPDSPESKAAKEFTQLITFFSLKKPEVSLLGITCADYVNQICLPTETPPDVVIAIDVSGDPVSEVVDPKAELNQLRAVLQRTKCLFLKTD